MIRQLTAVVERESDGYVSLCPEVHVAAQGDAIAEARDSLCEALELFFESASEQEIRDRLHEEVYVTRREIAVGWTAGALGSRGLPNPVGARLSARAVRHGCAIHADS